jgi:asparagine synthase (glutamine-hydrolysing)
LSAACRCSTTSWWSSLPGAIKIRGGKLKYAMKRAVSDLLPQDILERGKRGFGTPTGACLKDDLATN